MKKIVYWIIFTIIILSDQLSKLIVLNTPNNSIDTLKNSGFSFGILSSYSIASILLSIIILGSIAYLIKFRKYKFNLGFSLLSAGIASNLLDRIFRGYVVDFIKLPIIPTFNLADISIILGIIGLLWGIKKWRSK